MNLMLKYLKALIFISKRYYFSTLIRRFDKRSDALARKSQMSKCGYEIFDMHDLFYNASDVQSALGKVDKQTSHSGVSMSWDLPEIFWEQVLKSEKLKDMVIEYLGDTARLDDAYLKTINDGVSSVSEGWHNDNVGYRLKLFIVFNTEGKAAPTLVLPRSRPNLYHFDIIGDTSRVIFRKSDLNDKKGQVFVSYQSGTCLMFDTNLEHRGGYSDSDGIRHCVVLEFMCRKKARRITGFSPCGPRQGNGSILIRASEDTVFRSPLIDKEILSTDELGSFKYGVPEISSVS